MSAVELHAGGSRRTRRAFFQLLLPNEPRIADPVRQAALTERYLLPVLRELEVFLLSVRLQLDPELERRQPVKLAKP